VTEVCIAAAVIGQHEQPRPVNEVRLAAQDGAGRTRASPLAVLGKKKWQDRTVERYANERQHLRAVAFHLPREDRPSRHVLAGGQIVDSWTWPRNQIGDAEPEL